MSERVLTVGGNKASRPIDDFMIGIAGTEFYVGPNATGAGDDGRSGRSKETSLATLQAAIDLATASKNDIIYLLPGHAETVATAGAIAIDEIGLRVINLGTGALAATFTFSAVDATITMTAASCSIEGFPILKPSIDAVVSPIVVSAADCKVDVEIQDATYEIECESGILTTDAADNIDIDLKYKGFINGDVCVTPVSLVGVNNGRVNVDFYGAATTAIVNFNTTACTDIIVTGNFYNEDVALTKNVVDSTSSTWSVDGWDGKGDAHFSGGNNQGVAYTDIETALSDLILIRSDTIGMMSDLETIGSDVVLIRSDTIGIMSDLETIGSDVVLIRSDTIGMMSDLETIASHLVVTDGVVDLIRSDTIGMMSDLETIGSDVVLIRSDTIGIMSDLRSIRSDTTGIMSDLETIGSDVVLIRSDTIGIMSDLEVIASDVVLIRSDTIGIMSDLETIGSDVVLIRSDTIGMMSDLKSISSHLTFADGIIDTIRSDTVGMMSDLETIGSDVVLIRSDTIGVMSDLKTIASHIVVLDAVADAQPRCVEKVDGTVSLGDDALFTVSGGPIRAKIVGYVTTVIGGASSGKLTITTDDPSATADLSAAAVAIDNDPEGTMYLHVGATAVFTPTTTMGYAYADPVTVEETELIITPGLIEFNATSDVGGVIKWYMTYEPLSPVSVVTVEA